MPGAFRREVRAIRCASRGGRGGDRRPGEAAPGESVHEFAHAVSLALDPSFSNNPRWFWEAVAVYEAREVTQALFGVTESQFGTMIERSIGRQ